MNKKTSEIVRKILFGMAIFSFVITLLEGCVFYQYIENGVFRFLPLQMSVIYLRFGYRYVALNAHT